MYNSFFATFETFEDKSFMYDFAFDNLQADSIEVHNGELALYFYTGYPLSTTQYAKLKALRHVSLEATLL